MRVAGGQGASARDVRGHSSDRTAVAFGLDLLECFLLGGFDQVELDSLSDRAPLGLELVEAVVQLVVPLGRRRLVYRPR